MWDGVWRRGIILVVHYRSCLLGGPLLQQGPLFSLATMPQDSQGL